ncbi:MAG: hypothetical protein A2293_05605 [Elusimicrobia bacterium RIFOXYB2_FULL_49_7]|nr:MAG: hypothetical protein A2293_05605 [Elusimicrobia bacterium RIFOXYB2_FULL_49_7]
MRLLGFFTLIPVSILLTISYFVLYVNQRTSAGGLNTFGKAVVVLLWIAAGLILSAGLYIIGTGVHPMMSMCR